MSGVESCDLNSVHTDECCFVATTRTVRDQRMDQRDDILTVLGHHSRQKKGPLSSRAEVLASHRAEWALSLGTLIRTTNLAKASSYVFRLMFRLDVLVDRFKNRAHCPLFKSCKPQIWKHRPRPNPEGPAVVSFYPRTAVAPRFRRSYIHHCPPSPSQTTGAWRSFVAATRHALIRSEGLLRSLVTCSATSWGHCNARARSCHAFHTSHSCSTNFAKWRIGIIPEQGRPRDVCLPAWSGSQMGVVSH